MENEVLRLTVEQFETLCRAKNSKENTNGKRPLDKSVESRSMFNMPFSESDKDTEQTFLNNGEALDNIVISKNSVGITKGKIQCK